MIGPGLYLLHLAAATWFPMDHSEPQESASPCYLLVGHLVGGLLAAVALFSPGLRRAELWLILAYYCMFWLFVFSLVARRGSVEMMLAVLVAAAAPPACGLVRVVVAASRGAPSVGGEQSDDA